MLLKNSFNGGSNSATITTGNSGGASGNAFTETDGSVTYTSTNATGDRAPLVGQFPAGFNNVKWTVTLAARTIYAHTYVYLTGYPSSGDFFIWFYAGFGGGTLWLKSNGTLSVASDTFDSSIVPGTTTANPLPLNQWVRVEAKLVFGTTSSNGSCELRVYHDADSAVPTEIKTATGVDIGTTLPNSVWFRGFDSGSTLYLDDVGVSDVDWIGPPVPVEQVVPVGQATQTDRAQPIAGRKARVAVQAVQADHAQPVAVLKARATGQPSEADTALPILGRKIYTVGQPAEPDTALPIVGRKIRTIGQAAEADAAQQIIGLAGSAVGQAAETDLALPIAGRKIYTVGQAVDTSTALPVQPAKTLALGQVLEDAAALAARPAKAMLIGQAVETDLSLRLYIAALGHAVEADMALPIAVVQSRSRPSRAGHPYVDWRASTPYI